MIWHFIVSGLVRGDLVTRRVIPARHIVFVSCPVFPELQDDCKMIARENGWRKAHRYKMDSEMLSF
jgi:hypothetical protein